jgi:hypothetical protein
VVLVAKAVATAGMLLILSKSRLQGHSIYEQKASKAPKTTHHSVVKEVFEAKAVDNSVLSIIWLP